MMILIPFCGMRSRIVCEPVSDTLCFRRQSMVSGVVALLLLLLSVIVIIILTGRFR